MSGAQAVVPYYSIRSQSEDAARELAGWAHKVNLYDKDECWYGTFAITGEYQRSFRSDDIARCLFGPALSSCDSDCATFRVSGSRVVGRGANDLLADYFGLAPTFQSTISVKPTVTNGIIDFDLYVGLDGLYEGFWFRVHAPVVFTRWELEFCESNVSTGTQGYEEGYFAPTAVAPENLNQSFTDFVSGKAPNLGTVVTYHPLCFARWSQCTLKDTKLSDIQMALGWNFCQDCDYHIGLGIRAAFPTGTRVGDDNCENDTFLFAPVVVEVFVLC
jgi:hypothetical protein